LKIESRNLPRQCQEGFADMVRKPLANRIKKANKQIKETKDYFHVPNYKGVLILVNDGNYSLESDAVMYLLDRIVNTENTGIDSIIYFTVNMRADMPNVNRDILIWIDKNRKGSEGAPIKFLDDFRDGWMKFLEKRTGESIPNIPVHEHERLEDIKFIKDKIDKAAGRIKQH
jgi:hypothetical protein